jgi:hypothetical protein
MVEFTYQLVLSTLQTVALVVGIVYYLFIIRNSQRNQLIQMETRQTQLFMGFVEKLSELRVQGTWREVCDEWSWTDYGDFMHKYGPDASPEEWMKFMATAGLFETMGVLATHGSVDVKIMYDLQGGYPIRLWEKYEDIIDGFRIEREDPPKGMWMEYFEDLVYMLRDERAKDICDLDNRLKRRRIQREKLGKTMPDYS